MSVARSYQRAGHVHALWRRFTVLLALALAAFGAGCVHGGLCEKHRAPRALDTADSRARQFDRVDQLVQRRYYARDLHGVDWATLCARYRPAAIAASDEREWYVAVNRMLRELRDVHTRVERRWDEPGNSGAARTSAARPSAILESTVLEHGIVYARFSRFDDASFRWLETLVRDHRDATGFILDLRTNRGGLITSAQRTVGLFFPRSVPMGVVVTRAGRHSIERSRPARWGGTAAPLAVLIGGGSHSSAEVFAYVVHHHGRGVLVGSTTAGEVLGARPHRLDDGGDLFISETDFHRLEGGRLEGKGVDPDI